MSRRILLLTLIAGTLAVGAVVYILVGNVGEGPPPEEAYDPAPGYKLLQDPTEGLTVEVPRDWRVLTGSDSEGEPPNWSSYAGQKITSSVSAAPDLEAWRKREGPGTHIVASRNLARRFSDGEIVSSGPTTSPTTAKRGATTATSSVVPTQGRRRPGRTASARATVAPSRSWLRPQAASALCYYT